MLVALSAHVHVTALRGGRSKRRPSGITTYLLTIDPQDSTTYLLFSGKRFGNRRMTIPPSICRCHNAAGHWLVRNMSKWRISPESESADPQAGPTTNPAPKGRRPRPAGLAKTGDPGWIRTSDPQLRRLMLYPAELRGLCSTGS